MITIISGTNRKSSECLQFAKKFFDFFEAKSNTSIKILSLEKIPHDWFHPDMYSTGGQSKSLAGIQDEYMLPAEKFLFLIPEYNGGFPGVIKLFLDACSVRQYAATFKAKKAALVGIASGRAGNLRGMEHLTGVLNHIGTIVMPNKLPISNIGNLTNERNEISDKPTLQTMESFVEEFLEF